jgi:hypothetical protein
MILSDYKKRSADQQLADLNAAWDRIKSLAATNDQQQAQIQFLKDKVSQEKLKRWVVTFFLVALWEVVKLLVLHR